ncbi:hypothetical protein [Coleofasciculus sp.]
MQRLAPTMPILLLPYQTIPQAAIASCKPILYLCYLGGYSNRQDS